MERNKTNNHHSRPNLAYVEYTASVLKKLGDQQPVMDAKTLPRTWVLTLVIALTPLNIVISSGDH